MITQLTGWKNQDSNSNLADYKVRAPHSICRVIKLLNQYYKTNYKQNYYEKTEHFPYFNSMFISNIKVRQNIKKHFLNLQIMLKKKNPSKFKVHLHNIVKMAKL